MAQVLQEDVLVHRKDVMNHQEGTDQVYILSQCFSKKVFAYNQNFIWWIYIKRNVAILLASMQACQENFFKINYYYTKNIIFILIHDIVSGLPEKAME